MLVHDVFIPLVYCYYCVKYSTTCMCTHVCQDFFHIQYLSSFSYTVSSYPPLSTHAHTHTHSSDAHDYDICIKFTDILIVTTFHKSIVPSIEFSLKEKEVSGRV